MNDPTYVQLAKRVSIMIHGKAYFTLKGILYYYDRGEGPTRIKTTVDWVESGSVAHEAGIIIDEIEDWLKEKKDGS